MHIDLEKRIGLWARTGAHPVPKTDLDRFFYIKTQEAVNDGVALLTAMNEYGKTFQFSKLLSFLARKRRELSLKLYPYGNEHHELFGEERIDPTASPIPRSYRAKAEEFTKESLSIGCTYQRNMLGNIYNNLENNLDDNITGVTLVLTGTLYNKQELGFFNNYFSHTDPKYFKLIKEHCQELFQEALESEDTNKTLRTVARLHWWMANATFYKRGSASISDNLTKCLFGFKKINYGSWKEGLSPDIEAFLCFEEEFAQKYKLLFKE